MHRNPSAGSFGLTHRTARGASHKVLSYRPRCDRSVSYRISSRDGLRRNAAANYARTRTPRRRSVCSGENWRPRVTLHVAEKGLCQANSWCFFRKGPARKLRHTDAHPCPELRSSQEPAASPCPEPLHRIVGPILLWNANGVNLAWRKRTQAAAGVRHAVVCLPGALGGLRVDLALRLSADNASQRILRAVLEAIMIAGS